MTDYREQSLLDAAKVFGEGVEAMRFAVDHPESDYAAEEHYIRAYVKEREARLRLEEALRDVIFASAGLIDEAYLWEARAVLEPVKEG